MIFQIIATKESEINNSLFDIWSIVHYAFSFFLFVIIFYFITLNNKKNNLKKNISKRKINPIIDKNQTLIQNLRLTFILMLILVILWELIENNFASEVEIFANIITDLIIDILGMITAYFMLFSLLKTKTKKDR